MVFGGDEAAACVLADIGLKINDVPILLSDCCKNLGVIMIISFIRINAGV